MQLIQQSFNWFFNAFRRQGSLGKIILGGISLFVFCCLCSIPLSILSPSTPSETTSTPASSPAAETTPLMIPIAGAELTETANATTNTPIPTNTLEAAATVTQPPPVVSSPMPAGAACIPANPHQTGKVVDVVDGDTIKVLFDQDGKVYTVRYIGVDTPESTTQVEYFGMEAAAKNAELVFGKSVTLIRDVSETDVYGRLLRYVLVDNIFINYELAAQGYANTATFPPDIACIPVFQEAEQKASSSKLGLWNAPPTLAVFPTSPETNVGANAPCNCSGSDLDCGDFQSHASAQACYSHCRSQGFGDVFRLDGSDNDGLACENLP